MTLTKQPRMRHWENQHGTERFQPDGEEMALMMEYIISGGEPKTREHPGAEPDCEISEVYVRSKMKTQDVTKIVDMLEGATGLPIFEKLQEFVLERNT